MPAEELVVENLSKDGIALIRLIGPLTVTGVFKFQSIVRAQTAPGMIIDMTAVPYADSAGIGSLVLAHVSCQKAGRKLALVGVASRPMEVMKMTRVHQLFSFFPSVEDAEQKLMTSAPRPPAP